MKNSLVIVTLFNVCVSLGLQASIEIAGFQRLTGTPAEDTKAWGEADRFVDIDLEALVAFSGVVTTASGTEVATSGAFWSVDEFKYVAGVQPRHFVLEFTSGAAAGSRFGIMANQGNSLTIDLNGGSLAGVVAGDGIKVIAKWSLDQLFPGGRGITPSTDSVQGSEVLLPEAVPGGVDFSASPVFQYRSDLGRWVNVVNPSADAGDEPIDREGLVVIRQSSLTPLQPVAAGFGSTGTPVKMTVSYLQQGHDLFSNALSISGDGGRAISTTGATGETNEPMHEGNAMTTSVWFQYTAAQSGTLVLSSEHSDFDTILAAYSGTSVDALTLLASNDDEGANPWSEVSLPVVNGQTYRIALDGKGGVTGAGFLSWELQPGAPEISVEDPIGTLLTDGSASVDMGSVEQSRSGELTFTIRNEGSALLSGLATSVAGTDAADFVASTPGLSILAPSQSTTFTVRFEPGRTGSHTATLQIASNDADENPFDVTLTGLGIPLATLTSWGGSHGLSGNSLLPTADDDGDSITLIEEYAYNLDPNQNNLATVTPDTGTSGMPLVQLEGTRLQVQFVRRRSEEEVTAKAVFGDSLTGPFAESTEPEAVTPIDDYYERVVIYDSVTSSTASSRFAKVMLETVSD